MVILIENLTNQDFFYLEISVRIFFSYLVWTFSCLFLIFVKYFDSNCFHYLSQLFSPSIWILSQFFETFSKHFLFFWILRFFHFLYFEFLTIFSLFLTVCKCVWHPFNILVLRMLKNCQKHWKSVKHSKKNPVPKTNPKTMILEQFMLWVTSFFAAWWFTLLYKSSSVFTTPCTFTEKYTEPL